MWVHLREGKLTFLFIVHKADIKHYIDFAWVDLELHILLIRLPTGNQTSIWYFGHPLVNISPWK